MSDYQAKQIISLRSEIAKLKNEKLRSEIAKLKVEVEKYKAVYINGQCLVDYMKENNTLRSLLKECEGALEKISFHAKKTRDWNNRTGGTLWASGESYLALEVLAKLKSMKGKS